MFNFLKPKPKIYWFRIYYGVKVETNIEVRAYPDNIRTVAPDEGKALVCFKRDNPHACVTAIMCEGAAS
jgi:anti-sigma regulatory factor (Ser/Thr protein kinase)